MSPPVRLVATDLDGTLLGLDHVVSQRTRGVIAALVAAGVHVVAATGRSEWTAEPLVAPVVGMDLIVCSNGASLYDVRAQRSLASYPIEDAVVGEAVETLAAELPGCAYGWETDDALHYEAAFLDERPLIARPASPDLASSPGPLGIRKLMVAHPDVGHYELLDALLPLLPPGCVGSTSGAPFVEITGAGIDKAFGVHQVCTRLGIAPEEVLAFGDNHNDVRMLQWAGRGIAMGNAHESVRSVVDETALSNVEDGVAAVLETLL